MSPKASSAADTKSRSEHEDAPRSRSSTTTPDPREDVEQPLIAATTSGPSVWIQVCGEVDLSNRAQLQAALSAVDLEGARTVRLDLQHLTFCDTGGCRQLLRFVGDARRSGYQISIHGAKSTVRKVLGLIAGADQVAFA